MNDEDFMRIALREAAITLKEGGQPVGAVITSNGAIIAQAHKDMSSFHMGHAEMVALSIATKGTAYTRKDNLVLYTTLEPCIMCFGAILHCPITKVVYAFEDPWGGATTINAASLPVRHALKNPEIVGGVLREESKELMREFLDVTDSPFWQKEDNVFVKLIRS
jgi:tRNA(adenine34) deaminase